MSEFTPNVNPVRIATPDDIAVLPRIEAAADKVFEDYGITDLPAAATEAELMNAKLLLVYGTPAVGFARVEQVDDQSHLEQVSVLPEHSGQGIGTNLIESAFEWARNSGYATMTLTTFRDIPWNAPFYETLGFAEIDELAPQLHKHREDEIRLGLDALGPRVAMQKTL